MTTSLALKMLWLHFIGDFVLQTNAMAMGKSKSNKWLTYHIAAYATPMLLLGFKFTVVNSAIHWVVDWVTSRITSKLWAEKRQHAFFVVIGFDQAVHLSVMVLTAGMVR